MPRSVTEWIGATDDAAPTQGAKARVFNAQEGRCAACDKKMGVAGEQVEFDHVIALVNGGENRETNLQALCRPCHRAKTKKDMAEKTKVDRVRAKHLGFRKPRSPLPGGRGSKFKRKIDGTVVVREE